MTAESGSIHAGDGRPTDDRDRSGETSSTSIHAFQRNKSLAGFITDNADLTDAQFVEKHPHPVLLTSMPDEISLAVWTVVLPVKKKTPWGVGEETLSKKAKDLYFESLTAPNRYYIGRAPECDVVLAPRSISRRHAILDSREGRWLLTDLGSTNGTKVNGRLLTPKTPSVLGTASSKVEFGTDTLLWFVPAMAFLDYIKALKNQVPETPPHGTECADNSLVVTPKDPIKLPKKDDPAKTKTSLRLRPPTEKERIAEAETNPLLRYAPGGLLGAESTVSDEDQVSLPPRPERPTIKAPALGLELREELQEELDAEPRLMAAIKALAAMDSLILSVTAKLKNNPQLVTISTAEGGDKTSDIADQLVRLGPMLRNVWVKLSVNDGTLPIEIYSTNSSRLGRVSEDQA